MKAIIGFGTGDIDCENSVKPEATGSDLVAWLEHCGATSTEYNPGMAKRNHSDSITRSVSRASLAK
jgi:hypothetical protein